MPYSEIYILRGASTTASSTTFAVEFIVPGRRGALKQIRANLPNAGTGNVIWTLTKTDINYNQTFSEAITAATIYYQTDLALYCEVGDTITISSDFDITGLAYCEVAFEGNGV